MIVVGVDSSLTSTGLARVDTRTGEWQARRVRTAPGRKGDVHVQGQRMRLVAAVVADWVIDRGQPADVVVLEGLSHGSLGNATRDLAGLWWSVVQAVWPVPVMVIAPATRAKYAAGSGRAGKSEVLCIVRETYPAADVQGHDVADAVALAALGARVKGYPVEARAWAWMEEVAAQVAQREQEKEQGNE